MVSESVALIIVLFSSVPLAAWLTWCDRADFIQFFLHCYSLRNLTQEVLIFSWKIHLEKVIFKLFFIRKLKIYDKKKTQILASYQKRNSLCFHCAIFGLHFYSFHSGRITISLRKQQFFKSVPLFWRRHASGLEVVPDLAKIMKNFQGKLWKNSAICETFSLSVTSATLKTFTCQLLE